MKNTNETQIRAICPNICKYLPYLADKLPEVIIEIPDLTDRAHAKAKDEAAALAKLFSTSFRESDTYQYGAKIASQIYFCNDWSMAFKLLVIEKSLKLHSNK